LHAYPPTMVYFMGSDQQEIIGLPPVFDNGFTVDNINNVTLQTNVTVGGGTVTLTNGDILTVGNIFSLDPDGSLAEDNGYVDAVQATRTVSQNITETFGNIGFEITPLAADCGVTTVARTGSWTNSMGNQSIKRYFDVNAAGTPPYNATIVFRYRDSELNGNNESDLFLNYSTDGGTTWKGKTGTVSTTLNKVTTTTINNFGRFTLASAMTPLFTTHTITMKKFQNDNGLDVPGVAKKWYMELYENSFAPENLVNFGNLSVVTTSNIPAGLYICKEADSAGWAHVGHKIDNQFESNLYADSRTFDTIVVSSGLSGTFEFYNSRSASITLMKYRDLDGDPLTTEDQSPKEWGIALYRDTVGGTPLAEADTDTLVVTDLAAGTYIAVEADSSGWYRCDAPTRYDTLVITGGEDRTLSMYNVKANTVTINKYRDDDGDAMTTADQMAKKWYFEVHKNSAAGQLMASADTSTLTVGGLPDGTYYIVEADSTPWVSLGHAVDGVYQSGSAGTTTAITVLADGQTSVVDLYNAPPIYGSMFRTLNPDSIALSRNHKGRIGISVATRPVGVDFAFSVIVPGPGMNGLHIEFGAGIDTTFDFYSVPATSMSEVARSRLMKWDLSFESEPNTGDTVWVYGHGNKGFRQQVRSYWWMMNTVRIGNKYRNPPFAKNERTYPMPNRINILESSYPAGFPTGMVVGVAQTVRDSVKKYGWVYLKKARGAYRSLSTTSRGIINLHDGAARGFDSITMGLRKKNFVGKYTFLPPNKQDNVLFANLLALKVSIAASAQDITPVGLGDLILNDTDATNPWNGKTLIELCAMADTMMTGYPNRTFETADHYARLATTLRNILDAFEGPIDTNSFVQSLVVKGAQRLIDCKILKANPSAIPYRIIPSMVTAEQPDRYQLYQNYPNPFNPVTTIQFDLPEPASITLTVYNILGQRVETLLDNVAMDEGEQTVAFNASNVASGIYFYRIIARNENDEGNSQTVFTDVRKMVLIR